MKKLFFMLALGLFATTAFTQAKGDFTIGGTINYSSVSSNVDGKKSDSGSSSYSIIPAVQYFLSDKFALGVGVGYMKTNSSSSYGYRTTNAENKQFIVSPSIKYYHKLADKFYYTPEFAIGYASGNIESESAGFALVPSLDLNENGYTFEPFMNGSKLTSNTLSFGLSILDFEFRPSKRIGLGLSCGSITYTSNTSEAQSKVTLNNFNINLLNSYIFSFKYYL